MVVGVLEGEKHPARHRRDVQRTRGRGRGEGEAPPRRRRPCRRQALGARRAGQARRARRRKGAGRGRRRAQPGAGARHKAVCWEVPHKAAASTAAAIVEGTMLTVIASFASRASRPRTTAVFDALLRQRPRRPLLPSSLEAEIVARAVNAARTLQNTPVQRDDPDGSSPTARACSANSTA